MARAPPAGRIGRPSLSRLIAKSPPQCYPLRPPGLARPADSRAALGWAVSQPSGVRRCLTRAARLEPQVPTCEPQGERRKRHPLEQRCQADTAEGGH